MTRVLHKEKSEVSVRRHLWPNGSQQEEAREAMGNRELWRTKTIIQKKATRNLALE